MLWLIHKGKADLADVFMERMVLGVRGEILTGDRWKINGRKMQKNRALSALRLRCQVS